MRPDVTLALSIALTLAVVSIGALRLIDVNEKEPFWALGLLVWLGVAVAGGAALAFDPERAAIGAALLAEGAKAVAICAGIAAIGLVGRRRGVHELNSVLDWLIYGAAAGAGFAIGDGFLRATFTAGIELQSPDPRNALELLWMTVQSCLTEAALGAGFGAALGLAASVRRWPLRVVIVASGLAVTVLARSVYVRLVLEDGVHAPGMSPWGAAAVAVILVLALAGLLNALSRELAVIRDELAGEATEFVTSDERTLVSSPRRRYAAYLRMLAVGDVEPWLRDRRLHDHQVALAFARRSRGPESDEVDGRRAAIVQARLAGPTPALPRGAGALAAVLVIVAGAAVMQQASGGQAPSTFATRTSLVEREARRLAEHGQPPRTLRTAILLVPADWRLREGRPHRALLAAGAREAYDLDYESAEADTVHYAIARYASAAPARRAARRLDREPHADAWALDGLVAQVRGRDALRASFCGALASPERCLP